MYQMRSLLQGSDLDFLAVDDWLGGYIKDYAHPPG
jgi:hypothetical protein